MKPLTAYRRTKCRSCKALIVWTITSKNKRMPLDLLASPTGNVVLTAATDSDDWGNEIPVVAVLTDHEAQTETRTRYTSHFATCPDAAQHRRTR